MDPRARAAGWGAPHHGRPPVLAPPVRAFTSRAAATPSPTSAQSRVEANPDAGSAASALAVDAHPQLLLRLAAVPPEHPTLTSPSSPRWPGHSRRARGATGEEEFVMRPELEAESTPRSPDAVVVPSRDGLPGGERGRRLAGQRQRRRGYPRTKIPARLGYPRTQESARMQRKRRRSSPSPSI